MKIKPCITLEDLGLTKPNPTGKEVIDFLKEKGINPPSKTRAEAIKRVTELALACVDEHGIYYEV